MFNVLVFFNYKHKPKNTNFGQSDFLDIVHHFSNTLFIDYQGKITTKFIRPFIIFFLDKLRPLSIAQRNFKFFKGGGRIVKILY